MDANIELLNYIYQNAQMGQNSINKLLEVMEKDDKFKSHLESQFKEYKEIFDEAEKTIKGKSADHITEMLMKGNLMGVIQIIRRMKQYKDKVDERVYSLADKLLKTEEKNLQDGRLFLN